MVRPILALLLKEVREAAAAGLGVLALVLGALVAVGTVPMAASTRAYFVPLLPSLVAVLAAAVLGARGFSSEFTHGAGRLLYCSPVPRGVLWLTKGLAGYSLYLLCAAVPCVVYTSLWAAQNTTGVPIEPVRLSALLRGGILPYLLALLVSSLGGPGLTAVGVTLLALGVRSVLPLLGLSAFSVPVASTWLALAPGNPLARAVWAYQSLLPAGLIVVGVLSHGRMNLAEPGRRWGYTAGSLVPMAILAAVLAVPCGLLRARFTALQPRGEISQVRVSADGRHVVFRASGRSAGMTRWALEAGSPDPIYLGDMVWDGRWDDDANGYLLLAGPWAPRGRLECWLVTPEGMRRYLTTAPRTFRTGEASVEEVWVRPDRKALVMSQGSSSNGALHLSAVRGARSSGIAVRPDDTFLGWAKTGAAAFVLRLTVAGSEDPRLPPEALARLRDVQIAAGVPHRSSLLRLEPDGPKTIAELPGLFSVLAVSRSGPVALAPVSRFQPGEHAPDGWVIDLHSGKKVLLSGLGRLESAAFSPDGGMLAGLCGDRWSETWTLRLYDTRTGRVVLDGAGPWREVRLFSQRPAADVSGSRISHPEYGAPVWSPDGGHVAVPVSGPGELSPVQVWNLAERSGAVTTVAHEDPPRTFAGWWHDGRLLVITLEAAKTKAPRAEKPSTPNPTGEIALVDPDDGALETLFTTRPATSR